MTDTATPATDAQATEAAAAPAARAAGEGCRSSGEQDQRACTEQGLTHDLRLAA